MPATPGHTAIAYFKATAGGTAGDEIDGLKDITHNDSMTVLDVTAINDTATVKTKIMGLRDGTFNLSCDLVYATVQNLIRSKYAARETAYLTVLWDGTNGFRYPVLVTNQDFGAPVDGLTPYTANLTINGAPTAIP